MYFPIRRSLLARPEPDNAFWPASIYNYALASNPLTHACHILIAVIIRKASTRVEMRVCQCTRFPLGSRRYLMFSL